MLVTRDTGEFRAFGKTSEEPWVKNYDFVDSSTVIIDWIEEDGQIYVQIVQVQETYRSAKQW